MRVAMYYNNHDVRLEEMPTPEIGPGELLVRVEACGICGSDTVEWYRVRRAPLVLGHEIAGQVAAVGEGVTQYKVGDRVFVYHHVPCNTCHICLSGHYTTCDTFRTTHFYPGGFAEYVRVPVLNTDRGVYLLPDHVSYEEGSFVEPLACVVRGARLARLQPGQTVLVLGSGITGLLHIQLARALGAGRIIATDVSDYRMEAARRFGADHVFHAREDMPARVRQVNDGRLADLVIACAGALPALEQAVSCVERGGTVLFFALTAEGVKFPISINDLLLDEITLLGSYSGSRQDATVALQLIANGSLKVRDMITHRFGLAEAQRGFELVAAAQESIKVIIEPQH